MSRICLARWLRLSVTLVCIALALSNSAAAAPTVNGISLRGLTAGQATTISFQGGDLLPAPKVLAPFAIEQQEPAAGGTSDRFTVVLKLPASVPPGIYAVRLANDKGISPPIMLGVDRLPQQPLAPQIASLPVAMSGALSGSQIVKASFAGKKDQPLVVDVEANRIGANFKPVVRVYDGRGRQIAWSPPKHTLGGDARAVTRLPADDTYTVELHDLLYRAGGPGYFRLKIGGLTYADFALPLGIEQGSKQQVQFASTNLPAGTSVEVDATNDKIAGPRPSAAPPAEFFTGAQPGIVVGASHESVETPLAAGQRQTLGQVPCAVSGVIRAHGEEDVYAVPVAAGQKLKLSVEARRFKSALDGVLIVRNAQGNELARNDDQPGTHDPSLLFTVPEGLDQIQVAVRDMENRFGDDSVYRLSVTAAEAPDFSASLATDTVQIPAGGTVVLPINVVRTNYNGPIRIAVEGFSGSLQAAGDLVPAGATTTLLTLTAPAEQGQSAVVRFVARAEEAGVTLARYVVGPDTGNATDAQPRLRHDIGLAVVSPAPLTLAWNAAVPPTKATLGGAWPMALSVRRGENVMGDVRLRVMTTQPTPKKKIKENNQDKEVDDVDRMLRLAAGTPMVPRDQTDITANLTIPADLPKQPWTVVVVAELLAADGRTVVATANTRAESFTPEAAAN